MCRSSVRINGEWNTNMKLVEGQTSVTIMAPLADGGVDAGVTAGMDAGRTDAGTTADAGGLLLTLMTDKAQIIAGIGEVATITATLTNQGTPVTGETLTWSTTLGALRSSGTDAGTCTTDANGRCVDQLLAAGGVTGNADVAVNATTSMVRQSRTVRIVSVSQVQFDSVSCAQTMANCNLMGLQGSGFNETARVRFRVLDASNLPVAGIPVSFTLIGAPAGTSVDQMQISDVMGVVTASVKAGLTIGTFSVRATALSLTVDTPTIGVRGAKPSNRAFTLQCARVNLSAYNAPAPPRPIQINCQVGLSDRYNNPVGTGTTVALKSEAGTVPNTVATTAFSPGGANEGRGVFAFLTDQGKFPADDVRPLDADPNQFPFPLEAEPSWNDGPLVQNPRDGLVTIIAYVQGEEDFRDNNNNGTWDPGEQFIDQAEPFVDSNDNNVWDTGEITIDANNNGVWDGPDGVWNSTAQIWTETRVLYTGAAFGQESRISATTRLGAASSYGVVMTGTTMSLNVYTPDRRLNRVTSGASVTARLVPSTRGSVMLMSNTNLDGYGFDIERRLLARNGMSDCQAATPSCTYFTRIGRWGQGFSGTVTLVGASPPNMSSAQTLFIDTTVDQILSTTSLPGTFN
jgi:hypothetical protein